MNHSACHDCRLRFTPAQALAMPACPECGEPLEALSGAHAAMGLRLYELDIDVHVLPEAAVASMPVPPHL